MSTTMSRSVIGINSLSCTIGGGRLSARRVHSRRNAEFPACAPLAAGKKICYPIRDKNGTRGQIDPHDAEADMETLILDSLSQIAPDLMEEMEEMEEMSISK